MYNNQTLPPDDAIGGNFDAKVVISTVVVALAVLSVGLRLYTRIVTRLGLWWDDWLIVGAVLATVTTAVMLLLLASDVDSAGSQLSGGSQDPGPDPVHVYADDYRLYLQITISAAAIYFTVAGATNLGILLTYYRIFRVDSLFRVQLSAVSGLVVAWWLSCTVATFTACIPFSQTWSPWHSDPRFCFNYNLFWMISGVLEILLNVLIIALPVRAILRIQMSVRHKASIAAVFMFGGFAIVTGVVRVVLGFAHDSRTPVHADAVIWTVMHTGAAIVCASLPILRPLTSRVTGSALYRRIFASQCVDGGSSGGQMPHGWRRWWRSKGGGKWSMSATEDTTDIEMTDPVLPSSEHNQTRMTSKEESAQTGHGGVVVQASERYLESERRHNTTAIGDSPVSNVYGADRLRRSLEHEASLEPFEPGEVDHRRLDS